jgi:PPOX class probable F420-dependent enzyme
MASMMPRPGDASGGYGAPMLHPKTRRLAAEANFAVLTTVLPDETLQSHVMWVDTDDEHVLVNTEIHRRKFANLAPGAKATVVIVDAENPYSYVEVRGTVADHVRGPAAREHIDALSRKYKGIDYANPITSERVIVRIRPDRQVVFGPAE